MNVTQVTANTAPTALVLTALAAAVLVQTTVILGLGLAVAKSLRRRGAAVESACQRTVLCAALLVPCAWALIGLSVTRVRIPIPAFDESKPSVRVEDAPRALVATLISEPGGDRRMNNADQPESLLLFRGDGHQLSSPGMKTGQVRY